MEEFAAYAPIWKKRSYGGHTGDERVIRIETDWLFIVSISVPIIVARFDLRRKTLPVETDGKPGLRHYSYFEFF
jgi:hypothetical protein